MFGSSIPFTERTLTDLYHNKQTYLAEYRASLNKSISDGFILSADREALLAQAQQVQLPS